MEEFSDEIVDFLEYLKVKSAILIGNSMGGMLAQILAYKLANKCKGLFLSCTYKGKACHKAEPLAKNYEQRISERNKLNDRDFDCNKECHPRAPSPKALLSLAKL